MPQYRPMEFEIVTQQLIAIAEKVGKRHRNVTFQLVRDGLRARLTDAPWLVRNIALLTTRRLMKAAANSLSPALAYCVLAEQSGNEAERRTAEQLLRQCLIPLNLKPGVLEELRAKMLEDIKGLGGDVVAKRYGALA